MLQMHLSEFCNLLNIRKNYGHKLFIIFSIMLTVGYYFFWYVYIQMITFHTPNSHLQH